MRNRVVRIAAALLVVGGIVAVVAAWIETDEDRIERLVDDMRSAALAKDVDGILAGVAEDVRWPEGREAGGRDALRRRLESILEDGPPTALTAEVSDLEIEGDEARGRVDVVYRTRDFRMPVRLRVRFGKRDGRWVVTEAERF